MSTNTSQPKRRSPSEGDEWGRPTEYLEESAAGRTLRYVAVLLLLLALALLCAAAFFVARMLFSDSPPADLPAFVTRTSVPATDGPGPHNTDTPPAPGTAQVAINPQQGYINTLITVTGQGWWPGEPVFVFLRSRAEGEGPGYAYAAAVVDEQRRFHTAFTFPNEVRWVGESWADVIARGTRSGLEAITRFTFVVPTATVTVPPPTPRPTLASTATAWPTSTPFATATTTPDVIITDWRGEYFANPVLAGTPVFVRNDVTIEFNWGAGSPGPGIPNDQFSARWTRGQSFAAGFYRFMIVSDDGVRFWIDGHLLVDEWHDGALSPYSVDLYLPQGQRSLQLDYYENLGGAMVQLTWAQIEPPTATSSPTPTLTRTPTSTPRFTDTPSPSPTLTPTPSPTTRPTDTPTSTPRPTDTSTPTLTPTYTPSPTPEPTGILPTIPPPTRPLPDRWQAEFYANPSLGGPPVLVRQDREVNFDWRDGPPGPGISPDNFSARWTGAVWLPAGEYRYSLAVDDGARVWIGGQLVIDEWHPPTGELYVIELSLPEGLHLFQVDYFETTGNAHVHLGGETVVN